MDRKATGTSIVMNVIGIDIGKNTLHLCLAT